MAGAEQIVVPCPKQQDRIVTRSGLDVGTIYYLNRVTGKLWLIRTCSFCKKNHKPDIPGTYS